jgi:hypothetical protein
MRASRGGVLDGPDRMPGIRPGRGSTDFTEGERAEGMVGRLPVRPAENRDAPHSAIKAVEGHEHE